MTYQARGADPSKKLTGKSIHNYSPWTHSILRKLKVEKILFPINFLLQMETPIWNKINTWVIIQGDSLTMNKMFAEVKNYMDITQHKANAKKKLTTIVTVQISTTSMVQRDC